jgi:CRISPR/Cas system-associated exonuclease Cas4 (RecB family)
MPLITKNGFLQFLKCPVKGWIEINNPPKKDDSLADKYRKEEGIEIGKRARQLFPEGVLLEEKNPFIAEEITKCMFRDQSFDTIYEAAFVSGDFVTRADIIEEMPDGLKVYEVKSSKINTKQIKDLIKDIAYTVMVVKDAGYKVNGATLILLSENYRKGMSDQNLFELYDVSNEVHRFIVDFSTKKEKASEILGKLEKPEPKFKYECRSCDYFNDCFDLDRDKTIFVLHNMYHSHVKKLIDKGTYLLEQLDKEELGKDLHRRIFRSMSENKLIIDDKRGLWEKLNELSYPIGYLDFETVSTALPLYNDLAPYEKLPFQYSLHIKENLDSPIKHLDYLFFDPSMDESKKLAETLVGDTKKIKTLIAYHDSFEKTVIKNLIKRYKYDDQLTTALNNMIDKFVDLELIVKEHVYHPDFHGSFSIKNVLPALIPDFSYKGLEIKNGDDACYIFAKMARGDYSEQEIEKIRKNLLEYCKLDTLAMVKIHEKLLRYCSTL